MTTTATAQHVRVGNTRKVHIVTPAEHSGIMHRSLTPTCGAYLGSNAPRALTDEPVNCKRCQQPEPWSTVLIGNEAL